MFLSSAGRTSAKIPPYSSKLAQLVIARDGHGLKEALRECPLSRDDLTALTVASVGQFFPLDFLAEFLLYLRSLLVAKNEAGALEALVASVRKVASAHLEEDWLLPVLIYLTSLARRLATRMDSNSSLKWRTKLVEIFREIFPSLHKERTKLPATAWLISQLLALYMSLNQVKLCAHVLAALTQSLAREGGFEPNSVPKAVSVTLFYYWGKFHIMDSKYADAHAKLQWAYTHCTPHEANRRRIAEYLIPSMIVLGHFPKRTLEGGLDHFHQLTTAIQQGNVRQYNRAVNTHMLALAKSGTLVLMEKCKLLCYRNLVKRIVSVLKALTDDGSKLDLSVFEAVWQFAEDSSKDEMICALADLIYAGAMKGYLSMEHNKIVLSKVNPFPPIDQIL